MAEIFQLLHFPLVDWVPIDNSNFFNIGRLVFAILSDSLLELLVGLKDPCIWTLAVNGLCAKLLPLLADLLHVNQFCHTKEGQGMQDYSNMTFLQSPLVEHSHGVGVAARASTRIRRAARAILDSTFFTLKNATVACVEMDTAVVLLTFQFIVRALVWKAHDDVDDVDVVCAPFRINFYRQWDEDFQLFAAFFGSALALRVNSVHCTSPTGVPAIKK